MIKRILRTRGDGSSVTMATFGFDGGRLLASYSDEDFRSQCEDGVAVEAGYVSTDNPGPFFDALDGLVARSSSLSIVVDDAPHATAIASYPAT